jgi:hypothetical protein
MKIAPLVIALAMACPATAAVAQTAADRQACMGDVLRLCSGALPDRGKVISCIVRNTSQLGSGCRAVVARYSGRYGRGSQKSESTTTSLQ